MSDNPSRSIYRGLKKAGINFIVSVPCINLSELLCLISADKDITHVPVTREEEGIGVCAGAWMGGKRPAIMMQNSGLGNSTNALASLTHLYEIPLLMIISHRGTSGEPIIAQVPMGLLTEPLLNNLEIPIFKPNTSGKEAENIVIDAWSSSIKDRKPSAILLDLHFWKGGP